MADGIDITGWPTPRGPWPEVHDLTRLYDHGQPWCVNADGHPGDSGYPDPDQHLPWNECHGRQIWLDEAQLDLGGGDLDVCVYLAAPFRFGQLRVGTDVPTLRIMLEAWDQHGELRARLSIKRGEALGLGRTFARLVDLAVPLGRVS